MRVLGGVFVSPSALFGTPKIAKNTQNGRFGGTKNGTWGKEKENSEQLAHLLVFV